MEAVAKQRKSVVKRLRKDAEKEAKKTGGTTAKLVNVSSSPRKMRLVVDLVRGKRVNHALSILKFQAKSGAPKLEKLLLTAISDWQAKNADLRLEDADLFVKEIFANEGKMLKRLRPAPQGRAHRVRKRSNHITLTIDSLVAKGTAVSTEAKTSEVEAAPKAQKAVKAESKKTTKKTDK